MSSYYTTNTLRGMYSGEVMPILDPDEWCVPLEVKVRTVVKPDNPRQAGRPRLSRMQSRVGSSTRYRSKVCSRCHKSGHYRSSCKEILPMPQEEQIGSNQPSVDGSRKRRRCSICHDVGHTRVRCPQRVIS